MKPEHVEYLKAIGMKQIMIDRVEEIYQFYSSICPEEIEEIFVNDYMKEDDTRVYENVRFYTKNYTMLANDFLHKDQFNISQHANLDITYIRIMKTDYDFKKANVKSRLTVFVQRVENSTSTLRASKENCDYLKDLIKRRYVSYVFNI